MGMGQLSIPSLEEGYRGVEADIHRPGKSAAEVIAACDRIASPSFCRFSSNSRTSFPHRCCRGTTVLSPEQQARLGGMIRNILAGAGCGQLQGRLCGDGHACSCHSG